MTRFCDVRCEIDAESGVPRPPPRPPTLALIPIVLGLGNPQRLRFVLARPSVDGQAGGHEPLLQVGRVEELTAWGAPQVPDPGREPVDGYSLGPLRLKEGASSGRVSGTGQARADRFERMDDAARRLRMPDLVERSASRDFHASSIVARDVAIRTRSFILGTTDSPRTPRRGITPSFPGPRVATGYEVDDEGDAFLIAFARARDPIRAATGALQDLAAAAWPEARARPA